MNTVNKPFRKKDAMQLVTGQPVYMDDVIPQDCLIVKLLRSPHANAMVRTINTTVAKKVPGIEAIFTVLALHTGVIPPTINLENPGFILQKNI